MCLKPDPGDSSVKPGEVAPIYRLCVVEKIQAPAWPLTV